MKAMVPVRRTMTIAGVAFFAALAVAIWIRVGPPPPVDRDSFVSTAIYDRNGVLLSEPLNARGERSAWIAAAEVPAAISRATIAAEDHRFFEHHGIDPWAIARAAWRNLRRGRVVEGGSTITQQVAKLLLHAGRRTLAAKLRESIAALRLEHHYSKREILALYLNMAPYGNRISGIHRASRSYFGVAPEELTFAQAAFLASLPQRPGAFNPLNDPSRAASRQAFVLRSMALGPDQLRDALNEKLRFDRSSSELIAPHFVERVLEQSGGARLIRTTLDAALQREVNGIVMAHRSALRAHGAHAAAVAVLDNATGEWLAWEGSGDYFGAHDFGGAIDGVTALRQPGSTLKPFTYAVAFEQGASPATVLPDLPSSFPTSESGVVYTPRNYDGQYRGPMRVRAALAGSENVPAVAMLAKTGAPSLLRLLRNSGFRDLDRTADYYGLGLTLGDPEVRLEQLVAAYSMLARGGVYLEPRMVAGAARSRRMLSERTAFWITDILSDDDARAFIFGNGGNLEFPFPVAVKTGTSSAYRDNWTIGYTREVTVGVWVGNFDRHELRNSSGVTGAAPIFHDVMLAAVKRVHGAIPSAESAVILQPPPGVERVEICATSGLRPSISCPNVTSEWVSSDAPAEFCSWHHAGGVIDWPPEYQAWANSRKENRVRAQKPRAMTASLRITNPPDGATYMIDPTLRMAYQALRLRASSSASVEWKINGRSVGKEWSLRPGRHVITASDAGGHRDSVTITVR